MNTDFQPKRHPLADLLLCLICGFATFGAFPTALAPDYSFWPLLWISHVPILWVLRDKSPKQAFFWGLFTGTVINVGGYYWIGTLLINFGHLHWIFSYGIMVLHGLYLGLIWGLWAWIMNRVTNLTRVGVEWSAPLAMVAIEIALPRVFPAYMGNSQFPFLPVMQICDVLGITAVTFLLYRVNATIYLLLRAIVDQRPKPWKICIVTLGMLAACLIYGVVRIGQFDERMNEAPKLKVGVVEADIGIFEAEPPERRQNHLVIHQKLSAELERQGAELLVWAESAYRRRMLPRDQKQFLVSKVPLNENAAEDVKKGVSPADRAAPQRGFKTPVLFVATSIEPRKEPRFEGDNFREFNTSFLLDSEGRLVGRYDKNYLLVFGEYMPFGEYIPWIYKLIPALGRVDHGEKVEVMKADLWGKGEVRLGVNVCYEGIMAGFMRQFAEQRPHLLINQTNDDWFGRTAERYLHLALAIPRAIELRLGLVRSTLTGVSAIVDANGRLLQMTKPTDPETMMWDAPLLQSQTVYSQIGDVFPWTCFGICLWLLIYGRIRRKMGR